MQGEYVAGWIKRGPSGVIGTNKADATESAKHLLTDFENATLETDDAKTPEAVTKLLQDKKVDFIEFHHWLELDRNELSAGEAQGPPPRQTHAH